jgi:hypothetical protein
MATKEKNTPTEGGEVLEYLHKKILKETLKYAAGKQMFCRKCETILDWKTTVLSTFKSPNADETGTFILCTECYTPEIVKSLEGQGFIVEVDKW